MGSRLYVLTCECGATLTIQENMVGQTGRCAHCGRNVVASAETVVPADDLDTVEAEKRILAQVGEDGVPAEWNVGDTILNLYDVVDVLGEGGMGKVFKVHHRGWDMPLAVKSPKPRILLKRDGVANFERECETWVNLGLHPHITSCYYVRQLGGIPRVFAEFVDGASMFQLMESGAIYKGGPQHAIARICDFGIQIAWGLQYAHERGVVHQDVKPANVLITRSSIAKVTDFGLARAHAIVAADSADTVSDGGVTNVGMTRFYCSPEQALREKLTLKTDIWSWALSILSAFTVKVIWRRGTEGPDALQHFMTQSAQNTKLLAIPPTLAELLAACFRINPAERPRDMNEIAQVVQRVFREVTGETYSRTQPKHAEALADSLNNRALSLVDLGRVPHAEQVWDRAFKADPQHPESTFNYCVHKWRRGQLTDDEVLQRLFGVVKFHPGEPLPLYLVAEFHMERSDFNAAKGILAELLREFPNRKEFATALAAADSNLDTTRGLVLSMTGHHDSITAVAVSNDNSFILSGSGDNNCKLWEISTGECIRTLEGHQNTITAVAFNEDGSMATTSSADRTVRLWDLDSAQCVAMLEHHPDAVTQVCLTSDGRQALTACADGILRLFNVEDRKCVGTYEGHRGMILGAAMDSGGMVAVSGGEDGVVRVWDLQGKRCTHVMEGHVGRINALALSADGRFAASAGEDRSVRLWHPATGKGLNAFMGHFGPVRSVAMRADGRFAVSAGLDKTIRIWETASGRCVTTLTGHTMEIATVAMSKDGSMAVSGGKDRSVNLWAAHASEPKFKAPTVISQAVSSEDVLTQSRVYDQALAAARESMQRGDMLGAAKHIRMARAQPNRRRAPTAMQEWRKLYVRLPRTTFNGAWDEAATLNPEGHVKALCLSQDGRNLLVVSGENSMAIWSLPTLTIAKQLDREAGTIECVCMTPDGRQVLTGGWGIRLWDTESGKLLRMFVERQAEIVNTIDVTADGRFVASGAGRMVNVWDSASGRLIGVFEGHIGDVYAVAWSPDSRLIVSGGEDRRLMVWEVSGGKCLVTMEGHTQPIRTVKFSPDGLFVVTGSGTIWGAPGQVKLWNLSTGKLVYSFDGHTDTVQSAVISSDRRWVLSASRDSTVRFWDATSGSLQHTFEAHTESVDAALLTSDGRYVVTAGKDAYIRLWALDWELAERPPAMWDPIAAPIASNFLTVSTPYRAELKADQHASPNKVRKALTRGGTPQWTDHDFQRFLYTLGCAGFGWLDPRGVRAELDRMAGSWHVPSGLPQSTDAGESGNLVRGLFGRLSGR